MMAKKAAQFVNIHPAELFDVQHAETRSSTLSSTIGTEERLLRPGSHYTGRSTSASFWGSPGILIFDRREV